MNGSINVCPMQVTQRFESPTVTAIRELDVRKVQGGKIELTLAESSMKYGRKRWHSETAVIVLTAEQWAQIAEAVQNS